MCSSAQPGRLSCLLKDCIRLNLPVPERGRRVRNRRIFLLAAHPGEGLFTQPTAAAQAWRPELVFMPIIDPVRARDQRQSR